MAAVTFKTIADFIDSDRPRQAIHAARMFGWMNCHFEYCADTHPVLDYVTVNVTEVEAKLKSWVELYQSLISTPPATARMGMAIDTHITEGRIMSLGGILNLAKLVCIPVCIDPILTRVEKEVLAKHFAGYGCSFDDPVPGFDIAKYL